MDNAIVSPLYVVKTHVLPVSIKTVDANARVLRFAISDQRRDRDEDVVRQRGLDKHNYRPNPLVYWAHQGDFVRAPDQLPIAKAVSVEVGDVKSVPTTFADKLFVPEEVGYELSRLTYDLARLGFINCCSIGFMRRKIAAIPKEYWTPEEQKAGKAKRGYLIVNSELVESSLCGIPSNVGAVAQRGFAPNPEWDVDRVREVARKHLEGAALDRFIGELTGPEVLTLRAVKPEEAPEPLRELLVKAAARFEDVDDLGFDDYELHVGKARPVEATKVADPEPEPVDDEPPVAPVVKTGESAPAKVARLAQEMNERTARALATRGRKAFAIGDRVRVRPGMEHEAEHAGISGTVAEVSGTAIGIRFDGMNEVHRWYITSELEPADAAAPMDSMGSEPADMGDAMTECTDACHECTSACRTCTSSCATCTTACTECTAACMACVESCKECVEACVQMMQAMGGAPAVGLTDGAQPMTMASFAAEIRAELKALAARVEDSHAEFYVAHLNSKSNTAPRDTRSDPAPRVEAAKPPVAVAVKQPVIDATSLAPLIPILAKALEPIQEAAAERAIYKARGGVEIP